MSSAAAILLVGALAMAAAWNARAQRIAHIEATQSLLQLDESLDGLRPPLSLVALQPETIPQLRVATDQLAIQSGLSGSHSVNLADQLSADERPAWQAKRGELAYLRAHLELIDAVRTSDDQQRKQLVLAAKAWNDKSIEITGLTPAASVQTRSIDRLLDGRALTNELPPADVAKEPTTARDCTLLGLSLLYQQQAPEAAAKYLRRAIEMSPTDPAAWLLLTESEIENQNYSQAEAYAELAMALIPDSTLPWFQRGAARMQSGQYEAAADDFRSVLEMDPDNHRARMNLALVLKSLGRWNAAEEQLTTAIDRGFADPRAYFIRGRVWRALGETTNSESDIATGLNLPALDRAGMLAQGVALVNRDPHSAVQTFKNCLQLDTTCITAWQNLAHLYSEKLQDPQAAIEALTSALQLDPDNQPALAGRGVLFGRLGNVKQATQDAAKLKTLELDPITQYQLGCVYALINEAAVEHLDNALEALTESFARDETLIEIAATDPDLDKIRNHDDFRNLFPPIENNPPLKP